MAMSTVYPALNTPIYQTVHGTRRKLNPETIASQVYFKEEDGSTFTSLQDVIKLLKDQTSGKTKAYIVDTYADLEALKENAQNGDEAWVRDASGDSSVESGAAKYIFDGKDNAWHKLSEAESMDMVFSWDNIQGKPDVEIADINKAVNLLSNLPNEGEGFSLGENGELLYNGESIGGVYSTYVDVDPTVDLNGFDDAVKAKGLKDGGLVTIVSNVSGGEESGGDGGVTE